MYNKRRRLERSDGMENILNDIDDLFAKLPWNKRSNLIKNTICTTMCNDYETLISQGKSQDEAYQIVKGKLADEKVIAKYIPIQFIDYHTCLLLLYTIFYMIVYYFTSHPNFLQLFLPVRMEFPIIIAKLIQVTILCPIFGLIYYHFAKYLPQKYISRTYWQSCTCILIATALYACYFVASFTFIWHTVSGFSVETITQGIASGLMYFIYDKIISHQWLAYSYAAIIGVLFMMAKPLIQCNTHPKTFTIEKIYNFNAVNKVDNLPTHTQQKVQKRFGMRLNLSDPPQISAFFTNISSKKNLFKKEKKPIIVSQVNQNFKAMNVNRPRTKTHKTKKRPMMQNKNIILKKYNK